MSKLRLALLASHGGSNLQAIIDACKDGTLNAETVVVISNNSGSLAAARARAANIPVMHLSSKTHPDPEDLDAAVLASLEKHSVDLVALAGYMKRLGKLTVDAYRGRIINIHPSLLPRHGGEGHYGTAVHQAVLAAGDTETGNTIHLVDEEYDHGPTVAQQSLPVLPGDTAETLAERVIEQGHALYVETIRRIADGELALPIEL